MLGHCVFVRLKVFFFFNFEYLDLKRKKERTLLAIISSLQQLFDVWGFHPAGSRYGSSSNIFTVSRSPWNVTPLHTSSNGVGDYVVN